MKIKSTLLMFAAVFLILSACSLNMSDNSKLNADDSLSDVSSQVKMTDNADSVVTDLIEDISYDDKSELQSEKENSFYEKVLKIQIDDNILYADFESNSSAENLKEKLENGSVTLDMHDYGNFEKVSDLPWNLSQNDTQITTEPGDIILYQGDKLTIYYDSNSWSFTKVAKIRNITQEELKNILGEGDVTAVLSLE